MEKRKITVGFWVRTVVVIAVLALLFLVGMGIYNKANRGATQSKADANPVKETDVDVWVAKPITIHEYIRLPGSAEAYMQIDLASELGGTVDEVCFSDGERVKSGNCIVKLNTDIINATLKQDEANLALSQKNYKRTSDLVKAKIKKDQDLDQMNAELAIARASVERTRVQITKANIAVPKLKKNGFLKGKNSKEIEVIVNDVLVEPGEYVASGGTVAKLIIIDPIKVVVDVPEKDVAYLELGQEVEISFDPLGNEKFVGKIYRIGYVAATMTRTFPCEIKLANPKHKIRSGMIARVRLKRQVKQNAIAVPLFAVVARDEGRLVFVEADGIAQSRKVDFGIIQEQYVEITKGLSTGESLIVFGQRMLRDGEKVKVRKTWTVNEFRALKVLERKILQAGIPVE